MPVQARYDKPCTVYAITDGHGTPVYVGATVKRLSWRLSMHRSFARTGRSVAQIARWLAEADARNEPVGISALEVVPPGGDWAQCEMAWIERLRAEGQRLLNETAGGIGLRGRSHTKATRERMSVWQAGKPKGPMPDEQKQKISDTQRGRPKSEEHRTNISSGLRGRVLSEESRQKIAESLREYNRQRKEGAER